MTKIYPQELAAAKSGMTAKTARKYLSLEKLPIEIKNEKRHWKTRSNVFDKRWKEIEDMLRRSPSLEAKSILEFLMKDDNEFNFGHLRTLQRLIRNWRAFYGKEKEVIFMQKLIPGRQSQSDYTSMNELEISIGGVLFEHLLFHFMLPYSRWEYANICYSESFESLSQGYDNAVWLLGGVVKEHRTDNLTAATQKDGCSRNFTARWQEVMKHYGVKPSRNNPGVSHENGSVEKSHDLLKNAIAQQLYLRGSKSFTNIEEYKSFLDKIILSRNANRKVRLSEELKLLKALPLRKYHAPLIIDVSVSKFSTVKILKSIYSVPSRLIGYRLRAYIYHEEIKLHYGGKLVQIMPKLEKGKEYAINYRHIISSLVRKPNAFVNYHYKDCLFPNIYFRRAYDLLSKRYPTNGNKQYLKVLQLAAVGSENEVEAALKILLETNIVPSLEKVKQLLNIATNQVPIVNVTIPTLSNYDMLLGGNT